MYVVINSLMRFKAPIAEAIFLHNLRICTDRERCLSMCSPKYLTKSNPIYFIIVHLNI
jgi:hypothetical protein